MPGGPTSYEQLGQALDQIVTVFAQQWERGRRPIGAFEAPRRITRPSEG